MIEQIGIDEWLAYDAVHRAPTFFARPAWALALAEVYPKLLPTLLRIQTRGQTPVLLPVMHARGAFGMRQLEAFPLGGYTCFLREDGTPASTQEASLALEALRGYAYSLTLVPWPLGPKLPQTGGAVHETAVVDLSGGLDAALSRIDGNYRRMAGQAARRGVVCERAHGEDAIETYYGLLCESAKRWGIPEPTRRRALLAALVRYGGDDVEIWFARSEGRPIAGGVVFYGSSEFFFWSAAMLAEFGRLRPSNALNFALLGAAADRGMLWYNLGSSEGLPGVARFKRDLGAQSIDYSVIHYERAPIAVLRNVGRALTSRAAR
jgi:Acetyltransferase (GNAT) domain